MCDLNVTPLALPVRQVSRPEFRRPFPRQACNRGCSGDDAHCANQDGEEREQQNCQTQAKRANRGGRLELDVAFFVLNRHTVLTSLLHHSSMQFTTASIPASTFLKRSSPVISFTFSKLFANFSSWLGCFVFHFPTEGHVGQNLSLFGKNVKVTKGAPKCSNMRGKSICTAFRKNYSKTKKG